MSRTPNPHTGREWWAQPDGPEGGAGLRFGCTLCGNCCSGPPGYVLVDEGECAALAERLGLSVPAFKKKYTHMEDEGLSLNEVDSTFGRDCVFLDRTTMPGKAVCGVYEHRPAQCRTWPFWPSILRSPSSYAQAKRVCPGMDKGKLVPVEQVRVQRDKFKI